MSSLNRTVAGGAPAVLLILRTASAINLLLGTVRRSVDRAMGMTDAARA